MTHPEEPFFPSPLEADSSFQLDLTSEEFEIQFFQRIHDRSPDYVDVLRILAELFGRRGQYKKSFQLDRRIVKLTPNHCLAHYNLACSLSMLGHLEEAIAELRLAIQKGYDDFSHLVTDSDLAPLRDHVEYQLLLRQQEMEI